MTKDSDTTDNPDDAICLDGFLKDALRNLARPEEKTHFFSLSETLVRHLPGLDLVLCAKRIPAADQMDIVFISGPSAPLAGDLPPPALLPPFKSRLEEAFRHENPLYWKIDSGNARKDFSGWPESMNLSFFALFPFTPGFPEGDFFLLLGSRSSACFSAIDSRIPSPITQLASLCLASMTSIPARSDQKHPESSEMPFGLTESLSLLDALPDPAFLCNTGGTILGVNRAFRRALGNEETDWVGQDWGTLLPTALRKEWKRFLKNLPEQEEVFLKDITLPAPDRGGHMVRLSVGKWKNASGKNLLLGSFSDISVQIRLEKHLKESEEKYRRMFQFAPDGLFLADPETFFVLDGNPIFADMTGDHFRELLPEQSLVSLWDTTEKELGDLVERLRHSGSPIQNLRRKLRRKDGTFLHTSANLTLIPAAGEKETLLVQIRDVTGQTEMEGINWIFSAIDRMLLAGSPVDALLDVILQGLQDLFPFFSSQFFAPNPDGSIRLVRSASGSEEYLAVSRELVSSLRWNADEADKTSIGMALKSRMTRMMISETADPPLRMVYRNFGIRSTLSVPILRENPSLPWGTLTLTLTSEEPFSAELLSVLEKIASKISLAFSRHQELSQIRLQKTAMESIPTPMAITDAQGRIEWSNAAYRKRVAEDVARLNGDTPEILVPGGEQDELARRIWSALEKRSSFSGEIRYAEKSGTIRTVDTLITATRDQNGSILQLILTETDISDKKRLEDSLRKQAWTDALTGLPNRTYLSILMDEAIHRSRISRKALAVCFLDLDGFKQLNDQLGHAFGDQILVDVSRQLQQTVRSGDTVARLGGDEFVLLLENIDPDASPDILLNRILESVARPVDSPSGILLLTASIGVTLYPEDLSPADGLLRHADHALYQAKEMGRNRFVFFKSTTTVYNDSQEDIELPALSSAKEKDFLLEPELDLSVERITGLTLYSFEIEEITNGIGAGSVAKNSAWWKGYREKNRIWIRQGLTVLSELEKNGIPLNVSVPLDARLLTDPAFIQMMETLFAEFSPPDRDRLILDLFGTQGMENQADLKNLLFRFREKGVGLCLNDCSDRSFQSMEIIRFWPLQKIRIQPSLTRQIADQEESLAIFDNLVHLARAFGQNALASGVSNRDIFQLVARAGVRAIQGPVLSPPLTLEALPEFLSVFDAGNFSGEAPSASPDFYLLLGTMQHQRAVRYLIELLEEGRPFPYTLEEVDSPRTCHLGKWLDSHQTDQLSIHPLFRETFRLHVRAHALTGQIIRLHSAGKTEEAGSLIPEILACRDQIVENLRALPPSSR